MLPSRSPRHAPADTSSDPAQVFGQIVALGRRLERMRARAVRETGLTPSQHYLLALLSEKDMRPLHELQKAHQCSRATVTGLIDGLENKGLVVRAAHPTDRRSRLAKLTPKGAALMRAKSPKASEFSSCCCTCLGASEWRALSRCLDKLGRSLPP
jgi:DNA-binding MarR family transcriptional regulator